MTNEQTQETQETSQDLQSLQTAESQWQENFRKILFGHYSLIEEFDKVIKGLKQPHDSGQYKYAKMQIVRLWAPVAAIITPLVIGLLMMVAKTSTPPEITVATVTIEQPQEQKLDEIKPIEDKIDPPDMTDMPMTDSTREGPPGGPDIDAPSAGTDSQFSPQPAKFDSVAIIRSPIVMKGIYGSRTPGARGSALRGFGGGNATEAAVYRALRWLKKNQATDGSWPVIKPAMTGLALLTFLAHGETPASEEFGTTVEMAIRFLLDSQTEQGRFKGSDGNEYALPIAAYALSEAYGLTKIPDVKSAAERSIYLIVEGQNAAGGFNYKLEKASGRNDTSYDGWCVQALKAAKAASLEVNGLEQACSNSIKGLKANYAGNYEKGSFGYCSPGPGGLTAVGVLCTQLMPGGAKLDQVKGGLKTMEGKDWDFKLEGDKFENAGLGSQSLYYWYYGTQAKFHAGGDTWNKWNKQFSPVLVKAQHIIPKDQSQYVDHKGKPQEIGFWDQYKGHGSDNNPVFSTVLCALQLEVYYRYLPSFRVAKEIEEPAKEKEDKKEKKDTLKIDVQGV